MRKYPENYDEVLKEHGYHEFEPGKYDSQYIETKFQKRFDDEIGKKYFITINKWHSFTNPLSNEQYGPGYEFTTQFNIHENCIDLNLFSGWSVEEAEKQVEELWQTGKFDYYEVFDSNKYTVERK